MEVVLRDDGGLALAHDPIRLVSLNSMYSKMCCCSGQLLSFANVNLCSRFTKERNIYNVVITSVNSSL
jgi:hypothetical protein